MSNPSDICKKCNFARSYAHHCKECGGKAYHRFVKLKPKTFFLNEQHEVKKPRR